MARRPFQAAGALDPDVVLMGHPDAGDGRHRGHPTPSSPARPDPDHVRARPVHHRGAARRPRAAFCSRTPPPTKSVAAVRAVAAGDAVAVGRGDSPNCSTRSRGDFQPRSPDSPRTSISSPRREHEVLRMLANGLSNARDRPPHWWCRRQPSSRTSHTCSRKLGLRDRVQAVIYAYETRLISPGE